MARSDKAATPATLDPTKDTAKQTSKAAKTSTRTTKANQAPKPAPASKKPRHPYMLNDQSWDRQVVMDIVCNAIASSSKSIASILAAGHDGYTLPEYATVARWLGEEDAEGRNPLRDQYARAKEAQADYMAEELAELHEKAWVPMIDEETGAPIRDKDGRVLRYVDKSSAAVVRLEAENKKWLMGKLRPKKYADKQTHEHSGPNGGPIQARIGIEFVSPVRRAEDDDE